MTGRIAPAGRRAAIRASADGDGRGRDRLSAADRAARRSGSACSRRPEAPSRRSGSRSAPCSPGSLATLMLRHPSDAEVFFLVSAYPVAVVGSAAGLVLGLEPAWRRLIGLVASGRRRGPGRWGRSSGSSLAAVVAYRQPLASPRPGWVRRRAAHAAGKLLPADLRRARSSGPGCTRTCELWGGYRDTVAAARRGDPLALRRAARSAGRRRMPWSVVSWGWWPLFWAPDASGPGCTCTGATG